MRREQVTAEHRARMSRANRDAWARRRARAMVSPGELRELERTGTVAPSMRVFAAQAELEAAGFVSALGGQSRVSEQRMAIIQDVSRAGLLVRALLARTLQGEAPDLDAIAKLSTLINVRRQGLIAIGLDRVESDALDLRDCLASRRETPATSAGSTNGADPASQSEPREIAAQEGNV